MARTAGRFGRPLVELDRYGYVEEEWFLEGDATSYRAVGELTHDGRWQAAPAATAPFRTRLLSTGPRICAG